jgi:hypothetical protein
MTLSAAVVGSAMLYSVQAAGEEEERDRDLQARETRNQIERVERALRGTEGMTEREAARLNNQLNDLVARLRDLEPPPGEEERVELRRRIGEMERRLVELPEDAGQERREIQMEMQRIRRRLAAPPVERVRDVPPELAEQIRRINLEKEEIRGRLREIGDSRPEERRDLMARMEEIERQQVDMRRDMARPRDVPRDRGPERPERPVRRMEQERERPGGDPGVRMERLEEAQRKLDHIMVAAENLHAAGLIDQADRLLQQVEQGRREIDPQLRELHEAPFREMQGQIEELRNQIGEIHMVLRGLQEQIEELRRRE